MYCVTSVELVELLYRGLFHYLCFFQLYRVLTKQFADLGHEDRLVWRERAKMVNEERRVKENPKGKEKESKTNNKKSQRVPKRKPLPGEPKRPPM